MSADMNTELVCVMASLGYFDDDDYYKGTDCMESLKDLIRFLRKEDETCNIRRQMGNAHLLQKDLLPMLIHLADDSELVDIVVRLLVNLTSPSDMCFNKNAAECEEGNKKETVTNTFQTKYLEVISYLQAYKKAFTSEKALAAVGAQLGRILQMEYEDRSEDDFLLFERLLMLLRNILHVPSSPEEEMRTDDDASLHDQVLLNMHINGIDDLIIYISSTPEEGRWTMHVIEIITLMLREMNPEVLANTSEEKSEKEKSKETRELLLAKEKDEASRKAAHHNSATSRHSRFGGSFWVVNRKGIGSNVLVHHKYVADPDDISFSEKKYPRRVPKRRQPAKSTELERCSTLKIRLFLKEFCKKFLESSYNTLMKNVKDHIVAKKSEENDDTHYIWSMRFFMVFNRAHSFKVEYVSETVNMNAFHYILKQINSYYDQFLMHKRGGWEPFSRRLHIALQSYKELLMYIAHMDKSDDEVLKNASSVIKNNIFYHEEYRSIFLVLLRHYVISKHTSKFLADLIDTFHIFLKLLENFCKNRGSLLVKTKKKVQKKRKKESSSRTSPGAMTAEQIDELWENDLAPALSGYIQGYETLPENTQSPFDPASDVPVDEQRINAMIKIQDLLRTGQSGEAVSLLRVSRECWPEESQFGSENAEPENEFMVLRNLLVMELERPAFEEPPEEEENEEDEEEEAASVRSVEREFHLKSFFMSLTSPQIMMPYNIQLKQFKTNSKHTNHAVIKMMHRIAVDMKFPEMLFQLSTFMTFKEILEDQSSQYKEMQKFASYMIYKFMKAATENPDIYVEMLFWKTTGDCYQLSEREPETKDGGVAKWTLEEEGELKTLYDQYKESDDVVGEILKNIQDSDRTRRKITNKLVRMKIVESAKDLPNPVKPGANWSYEQEQELKTLYDEHKEAEDVVGEIMKNLSLSTEEQTRRKIINMLVRLRLVDNAKQLPKPPRRAKAPKWNEEQIEELHRLYEGYKNSNDILGEIMTRMTFTKSKQAITKQLIDTGKVADRKMLHKKRAKKDGKRAFKDMVGEEERDEEERDEEEIYDDWSDEDENSDKDEVVSNRRDINNRSVANPRDINNRRVANRRDIANSSSGEEEDSDDDEPISSNMEIPGLVRMVKEDDFSQQIIWLQTRLRRAAQDRDEDSDWYAMPLLTITEEDDNALQNKHFQKLLKIIGLRPPADEQEMFWRIPDNLSPQKLRQAANDLDKPEDAVDDTIPTGDKSDSPNISTKDDKRQNNGALSKRTKRRFAISDSDDDDDDDGVDNNDEVISQKHIKRKRILEENDDDDDDDDNDTNVHDVGTEDIDDSVPLHALIDSDTAPRDSHDDIDSPPRESINGVDDDTESSAQLNDSIPHGSKTIYSNKSELTQDDDGRVPLRELIPNGNETIDSNDMASHEESSSRRIESTKLSHSTDRDENMDVSQTNNSLLDFSLGLSMSEEEVS